VRRALSTGRSQPQAKANFASHVDAMWTHVVLGLLVAAISAWALWDERQNPHARLDRQGCPPRRVRASQVYELIEKLSFDISLALFVRAHVSG